MSLPKPAMPICHRALAALVMVCLALVIPLGGIGEAGAGIAAAKAAEQSRQATTQRLPAHSVRDTCGVLSSFTSFSQELAVTQRLTAGPTAACPRSQQSIGSCSVDSHSYVLLRPAFQRLLCRVVVDSASVLRPSVRLLDMPPPFLA